MFNVILDFLNQSPDLFLHIHLHVIGEPQGLQHISILNFILCKQYNMPSNRHTYLLYICVYTAY